MNSSRTVGFFSIFTVFISIIIGALLLNPLWAKFAVPGLFPSEIMPPITAPVDGIYYILNAKLGYRWSTLDPLSLWFHPLLSWLLQIAPQWISTNFWFWSISICFAAASLPLIYRLTLLVSVKNELPARIIPLCLLAPGGLGLATGNAEIPTLFFVLVLLLSVLLWQKSWLTILAAFLAMLTKPNSLYMVPILLVYFIDGIEKRKAQLWKQALIGIITLLLTWLLWAWWVDWQTGYVGIYWKMRLLARYYLGAGDIGAFFKQFIGAFYEGDLRNMIRYSTSLIIPLANLIIIGLIPLSDESHRYAMAAGNLAMLAITLYLANPNKVIVYTTTLPGYFTAHLILLDSAITTAPAFTKLSRLGVVTLYGFYCLAMILVFVLGTPSRWYH